MSKAKVPPKVHFIPWKWASDRTSIMENWTGGGRIQVWRDPRISTSQTLHFSHHFDQQRVKVLLHELLGISRIFRKQDDFLLDFSVNSASATTSNNLAANLQLFHNYDEKGVLNIGGDQTIDLCYIQKESLNHTVHNSRTSLSIPIFGFLLLWGTMERNMLCLDLY